mmetsp:Transcript_1928/g.3309  ORF Transcript_1928/g.3309 Transcript_1928/m.3309 type:complete len:156 (+) Transcript_1928:105-572(+)|eukprot:CAMPEP_0198212696 /NCGR_PEP_ID=MMETSP1445-20131203/27265_1 /TAXON_ID=36898 /ORGANISM="Pyramimonas sp., Strain CCMP2087" /LENGTH=155 /DNA_ID=CAMNT_0043887215 /DNA_START=39 /DNA_END=506 /DNA_ORIENTATION=+
MQRLFSSGGALVVLLAIASLLPVSEAYTDESAEIKRVINDHIRKNEIAIFSKINCPFSIKAKRMALDELGVKPGVIELDQRPKGDGSTIQRQLGKLIKADRALPTVPQIWVNGQYIGGSDALRKAIDSGKLTKEKLAKLTKLRMRPLNGPGSQEF